MELFFTVTWGGPYFGGMSLVISPSPKVRAQNWDPPPKLEKCSNTIYSAPATYSTPPGTRKP